MPIPKLVPAANETYDTNEKPPAFGHPLKAYFAIDDDYVNLNHGMGIATYCFCLQWYTVTIGSYLGHHDAYSGSYEIKPGGLGCT